MELGQWTAMAVSAMAAQLLKRQSIISQLLMKRSGTYCITALCKSFSQLLVAIQHKVEVTVSALWLIAGRPVFLSLNQSDNFCAAAACWKGNLLSAISQQIAAAVFVLQLFARVTLCCWPSSTELM